MVGRNFSKRGECVEGRGSAPGDAGELDGHEKFPALAGGRFSGGIFEVGVVD